MMCCANAVPRSKRSVTLVTRQPSFSAPTRFVDGHARLVEEQLAEVALAVEGPHRPDLDAGLVHVEDQPGDALVLRRVGVGADQQLAVVGDVRPRAPDLLAGDDVVVAVALRARARATRGRSRRRAPRSPGTRRVAAQDPREVVRRCSSLPSAISVGPACIMPTKLTLMYGRLGAGVLLEVDELLGDRAARGRRTRPARPGPRSRRRRACAATPCRTPVAPASRPAAAAHRARAPPSRATRGPRRGSASSSAE